MLKVFPPDMYQPFDPVRKKDHRFIKIDLPPYTTLYVYKDPDQQVKIYSSSDMGLISKDTFLSYISSDIALETLSHNLERETFPFVNLPSEPFYFSGEDLTDEILGLEVADDDDYNVLTSVYGDTLPLTYNRKTVNFAFLSQACNSCHFFNTNPGLHHTMRLKEANSIVVGFNPLFSFQNDPGSVGYINAPFVDRGLFGYLKKVLKELDKPFTFNLHSADDYYFFLKYLIYSQEQTNAKISVLSIEKIRKRVEFIVGFKTEINPIKMRKIGAALNETFLEAFTYDDQLHGFKEMELNLTDGIKKEWLSLRTELDGGVLRVSGIHSIALYKPMIKRFFGDQPIDRVGGAL